MHKAHFELEYDTNWIYCVYGLADVQLIKNNRTSLIFSYYLFTRVSHLDME